MKLIRALPFFRLPLFLLALTALLLAVACAPATEDATGDSAGDDASADAEYADKMAAEHAGDTPEASGAAGELPDLEGEDVVYAQIDGRDVNGFLVRPEEAAEGNPSILVIHEWWGLNDNVRDMARKLAGEGYVALAVDLYGGHVADTPEAARNLMSASMENEEQLEDNIRQAYGYLQAQGAERIGSIGWCFGGGWSLRTALLFPTQLDAAVIYYGRLVTDPAQLAELEMPVLGLFGAEDQGIPVDQVRSFEAAMKEAGKDVEIHVYEGADHAFANPSGGRYQAEAAGQAWAETTDFLATHLAAE